MPQELNSRRRLYLGIRVFAWTASLVAAAAMATGAAQVSSAPDMVTRKVRFRGGEDPNVKLAGTQRAGHSHPVVPRRSHPIGPMCSITFDNDTELITKTYIAGVYADYQAVGCSPLRGSGRRYSMRAPSTTTARSTPWAPFVSAVANNLARALV